MSKKGHLYVVKAEGTEQYKIGITSSRMTTRLSSLQTGCPHRLTVVYLFHHHAIRRLEAKLHAHFDAKRLTGEWFGLNSDDLIEVTNICLRYVENNPEVNAPTREKKVIVSQGGISGIEEKQVLEPNTMTHEVPSDEEGTVLVKVPLVQYQLADNGPVPVIVAWKAFTDAQDVTTRIGTNRLQKCDCVIDSSNMKDEVTAGDIVQIIPLHKNDGDQFIYWSMPEETATEGHYVLMRGKRLLWRKVEFIEKGFRLSGHNINSLDLTFAKSREYFVLARIAGHYKGFGDLSVMYRENIKLR